MSDLVRFTAPKPKRGDSEIKETKTYKAYRIIRKILLVDYIHVIIIISGLLNIAWVATVCFSISYNVLWASKLAKMVIFE